MASDLQVSEKTKEHLLRFRNKFQSVESAQDEVKGRKLRRKDPLSLFELRSDVQPIRVGDSLVESVGKIYRLIKRNDEKDVLQHELDVDRLEGQIEEEDRDNEKLIREIKKSSKKVKSSEKKEEGSGIVGIITKIIKKVKELIGSVSKFIIELVEKISSGIKGALGGISPAGALMGGGVAAAALTSMKGSIPKKPVYDYLRSKGVDHIHAMGMMTNIEGESGFRPGVLGDDNTSGGLFQWHDNPKRGEFRFTNMRKAIPDWQTNWKAQIDYALADKEGNTDKYLSTPYSSSEESTTGWVKYFERPKDPVAASATRRSYVPAMEKLVRGPSTEQQTASTTPEPTKTQDVAKSSLEIKPTTPEKQKTTKVASVQAPKQEPKPTTTPVASSAPQTPSGTDAKEAKIGAKSVTLVASSKNVGQSMLNTSIDNKVGKNGMKQQQTVVTNVNNYILKPGDKNIHTSG